MSGYNYCEKVDDALGHTNSKYRTLRSCFDPGSHEWTEITINKRIEILKKVVEAGNDLQTILLHYKIAYKKLNKPHVIENLNDGLAELLQYLLLKEDHL